MHQYSGIDVYLSSRVEERLNNFTEQELLDKTTFIICFSERKMDEHSLVHHSGYKVRSFRRYYGTRSRGKSCTYHQQVLAELNNTP